MPVLRQDGQTALATQGIVALEVAAIGETIS